MKSEIQKLADEVREETAKIPRSNVPQKGRPFAATEDELFKGLSGDDPEKSLKGILARLTAAEHRIAKLEGKS